MFCSMKISLSPAQFKADTLIMYTSLCMRVAFQGGDETMFTAGWYGGAGEIAMV